MSALVRAQDLGGIKNHFNILTDDFQAVQPEALRDFLGPGIPQTELAKILGVPRSSVYQKKVKLSSAFIREKIVPIAVAADLALEIFKSEDEARRWMLAPNSYYLGKSPFDVCLSGGGSTVIQFLGRKLGYELEKEG